ncbi:MAG: enoyl-CoA hydratase/isomerase family protein [Flavobacteriales bacterium]|nr:enoyl-CoA hydratase/isomerase family protein [Flavobacteriales bacterium]MDG1425922.1 enoyl-CoA hydratase/isomerase family protein [Flavobacteriales bacterium]MDG1934124.1 enoyl-CoA hydratase/isomerase family protein [Flavobacteriales bacterium]MDG2086630.1 enoyl-CoA hydratase/isomerase family protein [Flavobacteriales bacterium]|tara:strand:+ start:1514 stop:2269 length:756 start_codon:yes stop_codon:yes gene_type:complete
MSEYVKITTINGIGTIEFYHPQSNSLPGNILAKLATTITDAGNDKNIKVIILKSAGERAFCAGASFDELIAIDNPEQGKKFFLGFANVINAARKCPKFILGRVQGKAVGGGVGMAAATDYCFATKYSSSKLSELAIGIGPFVVGPAVERKIGTSAFSAMTINATKWFDANWSREKGLYTDVFDSVEELDDEIDKLASTLSKSNPEAMEKLKKVMWNGTEDWDRLLDKRAESSGILVISDFTSKAIAKFKSK